MGECEWAGYLLVASAGFVGEIVVGADLGASGGGEVEFATLDLLVSAAGIVLGVVQRSHLRRHLRGILPRRAHAAP